MLTPAFQLHQNDEYLLLMIKAPYVKANDVEIYMEGNEFKFFVKPYYLRLYFPCEIIEDGREKAQYDISSGDFSIHIPKKNIGESFPNLDMLTTLLAPKKKNETKPLIEIVGDVSSDTVEEKAHIEGDECVDNNLDDDDDMCWEIEQELYEPKLLNGYKYGFANQTTGVFSRMQEEIYEVIDLQDPENTSPQERRLLRTHAENEKFDVGHYQADYLEDDVIQELINYQTPWDKEYNRIIDVYKNSSYPETSDIITPKGNSALFAEETKVTFTDEENNRLLQLPNKEYILTKEEEHFAFLGLVDIIFAYSYNHRTTEGENTSESGWTISKLSSTLCWFDTFKNLQTVLTSSMRRCLCYPLYRQWRLIQTILNDVRTIFLLGKRWTLKCILEVRTILQTDENKYILNDLYITDYCVWLQKVKEKKILSLANRIRCLNVTKKDVDLNLKSIEGNASSMYESRNAESSSGSECDTSSDSNSEDDDSSDSSEESDDSDDVESEQTNITTSEVDIPVNDKGKPKIEVVSSKDNDELEIVCTGLEELLKIKEHVSEYEF